MEQQENTRELQLRFTVGGREYQIPVAEVERVLSLQKQAVSPLPFGLGGSTLGLFSFRGTVLPLVRITDTPMGESDTITVILLGTGEKRFGIAVDSASAISGEPHPGAVQLSAMSLYEGGADRK